MIVAIGACESEDDPVLAPGADAAAADSTSTTQDVITSSPSDAGEGGACVADLLGNGQGKFSFGSDACNTCVGANCCEPFATCYPTSGGTAAQMACFQLGVCIRACFTQPPDGGTDASTDGSTDAGGDAAADAGDDAATDAGVTDASADGGDGGSPPSCLTTCFAKYPEGVPLVQSMMGCITASCKGDAGGGVCK